MTVLIVIAVVVLVIALWAGVAWAAFALWNWLVPDLFSGPTVTYWQMCGILLLLSILSAGFRATVRTSSAKS